MRESAQPKLRPAAFFDMDHTVLRLDSGVSWMMYQRRQGELSLYELGEVLLWSLKYKLAILDMEQMATNLATRIEGRSEQKLIRDHHVWFDLIARPAIAPRAREAIAGHRSRGDLIVLCTGATQFTANELSAALDIEHVISTRLEVVDGTFTGRLESIAFLEHKLDRTEQFAAEHHVNLDGSWFYSDSFNDLPLMTRVGTPVAVNPDRRLRRHAARQGWKVESWR